MTASATAAPATARTWSFSNGADEIRLPLAARPAPLAPRLTADSVVAVHRAALAGGGLAIRSLILARPDIAAGRLVNLMPDFPPTRLPINAVYASRRNLPLRVRAVLEFLAEAVREDAMMVG